MTITNQDVKIRRADTATLFVALTEADGEAFDPTLHVSIKWRMSRTSHSLESQALSRKELGTGIELASGGVNITLNASDTDYVPGIYYHELKVLDASDVDTAMTGAFVIKRSLPTGDSFTPEVVVTNLAGKVPVVS